MSLEDLQYLISQYVDDVLPPLERQQVEAMLSRDPQARAICEEYRDLNAQLKNAPLPVIDFDVLSASLRERIAGEVIEQPVLRLTSWSRGFGRLAIAASVLLAVGVGAFMLLRNDPAASTKVEVAIVPSSLPGSIDITGPEVELATTAGIIEVSIGPGTQTQAAQYWHPADEVVAREPHVVIAAGSDWEIESEHPLTY